MKLRFRSSQATKMLQSGCLPGLRHKEKVNGRTLCCPTLESNPPLRVVSKPSVLPSLFLCRSGRRTELPWWYRGFIVAGRKGVTPLYPEFGPVDWVQYGNTVLKTTYCPECHRDSFVIDGRLKCCDMPIGEIPATRIRVASVARAKRRKPSKPDQVEILEIQNNECFYCRIPFGSLIERTATKSIVTTVCWDHYVPYSFSHNNRVANFVASCQICNGIKSSLMFDTPEDARAYIMKQRRLKGYTYDPWA